MAEDRVDSGDDIEETAADCDLLRASVGEHVPGVTTVTLDRPDARNALNAQLRAELKDVVAAIEDSGVRVVVLT
ncbi:3-hydroxybutyryl-CoA dehydratase, partial [Halobacteriales archaeon QH_2_66_30]